MSERRRGLGRGLGALIPAAPTGDKPAPPAVGRHGLVPHRLRCRCSRRSAVWLRQRWLHAGAAPFHVKPRSPPRCSPSAAAAVPEPAGAHFAELPLDSITPNPRQPREVFDEDALAELVTSIKEVGLLQPVVVRQVGPERYELIMGERRWRACREAGLEAIPAIVRATDDEKLLLDALLENLHRAQLNPLEEAAAYDQLLKDFNCTHDQLADRIGRSRPQVSNTLRLLRLSPSGAAQGRGRSALRGPCPGAAVRGRLGGAGPAGPSHRGRGAVGACRRGDRHPDGVAAEERSEKPRVRGPVPVVSPALTDLASRLSDRFETRVKVDLGQKKGKIVVEFASMDDLERILGSLAPGEGPVLEKQPTRRRAAEDDGGVSPGRRRGRRAAARAGRVR